MTGTDDQKLSDKRQLLSDLLEAEDDCRDASNQGKLKKHDEENYLVEAGEYMHKNAMLRQVERRERSFSEERTTGEEDSERSCPLKRTPGTASQMLYEEVYEYVMIENAEKSGEKMLEMQQTKHEIQKKQQEMRSDDFSELELKKDKSMERKLYFDTDCHKEFITDKNKRLYLDRECIEMDREDRAQERKERNTMLELLLKMVPNNNNVNKQTPVWGLDTFHKTIYFQFEHCVFTTGSGFRFCLKPIIFLPTRRRVAPKKIGCLEIMSKYYFQVP